MDWEIVQPIASAIVALVIIFLAPIVRSFLKNKGILDLIKAYEEESEAAVNIIQKLYKELDGEAKFDLAVKRVVDRLKNLGVDNIDEDAIKSFIQKAYNKWKKTWREQQELEETG